ncbi:MAG: hypothetical protein V2A76_13045 [Planctomycetota bacterium]
MSRPILCVLILLSVLPTALPGESYRSLTKKEDETAFYRSGGRSHQNRRVHLHVPARTIHGKPQKILTSRTGGRVLLFANRSVPLVIHPQNIYFRKILQRTSGSDQICVKGTVGAEPMGGPGRYAIFVQTLKKAP